MNDPFITGEMKRQKKPKNKTKENSFSLALWKRCTAYLVDLETPIFVVYFNIFRRIFKDFWLF